MRRIIADIQLPRMLFADNLYRKSKRVKVLDKTVQEIINEDMRRYHSSNISSEETNIRTLNYLLVSNKVFRTVFYYRIQQDSRLSCSLSRIISKILLPPLNNIEIGTKDGYCIKGGFKIMHSMGCIIYPYSAGQNFTVFQGVTVGDGLKVSKHGTRNPIIGDNVTIMPNSIVAGGINIGNDVIIGAGSVVLKDVPDNCLVIGNPARIIKKDGESVNIEL